MSYDTHEYCVIPVFHRGLKPLARDEIGMSWLVDHHMNN